MVGPLLLLLALGGASGSTGGTGTPPAPPAPAGPLFPNANPNRSEMPRTGQDTLTFRVPVYPRATSAPVPVGEQLYARGMPMNVQTFYTDDGPRQVLAFYKEFFEKWQLPMLGDGDMLMPVPYPSVMVVDEYNGVDIHVICMPGDANGKTLVMLAMSDIRTYENHLAERNQARWGGLPEYPGASDPSAVSASDGERRSMTVSFTTPDGADKVVEHYRKALSELGFAARPAGPAEGAVRQVDFARHGEVWHLQVSPLAKQKTAVMATWTSHNEESP